MSRGQNAKIVLVVDDEPEFLDWMEEFLVSQGLSVEYARNLPEALLAIGSKEYRLILVDMNIPALDALDPRTQKRAPLAERYPGIAIAIASRGMGYGAHSVIAYTVHNDDAAAAELDKLHCRYVLKGRPTILKRVLRKSLSPAP